jgi:hypothetical protein
MVILFNISLCVGATDLDGSLLSLLFSDVRL